jgi:cell division inhibitor SulA
MTHEGPSMNASLDQLLQHPKLWRATASSTLPGPRQSTGFANLDDALDHAGWPQDGLIELLADTQGIGELRALLPTLRTLTQKEDRWVAWVAPPHLPSAQALEAAGVRLDRLLLIHPKTPQEQLWALEQALKSGTCSALLGWLDPRHVTHQVLRRLQLAARQGGTLAFLFRPEAAAQEASPAELRLRLEATDEPGTVALHILKRRGGWPLGPLQLTLQDPLSQRLCLPEEAPVPQQRRLWVPRGPFRESLNPNPTAAPTPPLGAQAAPLGGSPEATPLSGARH